MAHIFGQQQWPLFSFLPLILLLGWLHNRYPYLHTCTNQNTTLHLVCNSKAKMRFYGLTNKDFRLFFFSKCTRSQTPVLFVHTSLISPSLPFRWDALTNPWQIIWQPSWGWMRLFSTCWNIPLPSSVSGSVMGPGTTQISPTFLAWPQAAYANKI